MATAAMIFGAFALGLGYGGFAPAETLAECRGATMRVGGAIFLAGLAGALLA